MVSIAGRAAEAAEASTASRLAELASDPSPQVRREDAVNPATPIEAIASMAKDTDWRTRAIVAARADVPAEAHLLLVDDRAWQVRFALADNAHADPSVWWAITQAEKRDIRQVFAGNEWIPESVAAALARDSAAGVRKVVASQSPHRLVLEQLLRDQHPNVRSNALRNALVTEADAVAGSMDRNPSVRTTAASCPVLPAIDLERLTRDRSTYVREAAVNAGCNYRAVTAQPLPEALEFGAGDALPDLTDLPTLAHWPSVPRKPSTKWFRIFDHYRPGSDDIPDEVIRFWALAKKIDRDPAWLEWWAASGLSRLDLRVSAGPSDSITIEQKGKTLVAESTSHESLALLNRGEPAGGVSSDDFDDELYRMWLRQLGDLLDAVGASLRLGRPPSLPKH